MLAAAAGDGGDERRNDRAPAKNGAPADKNATNSRKRSDENRSEGEANAKGPYICRFCNQEFQKSQALGGHMNRHRSDREKEELQRAQELVGKAQNQQRMVAQTWNMFAGGPAATAIPQSPYGQASGITNSLQALGAQPSLNFPPGSYYHEQHPMGPMHPSMLQQSSNNMQHPGTSSMQLSSNNLQQGNPGIPSMQQNTSNLDWTRNTNFNSNVQRGAPSNLRSDVENSAGNHLHQIPHWNQDDNMNGDEPTDLNHVDSYQNDDLADGIMSESNHANDPHFDSFQ